MAQSSSEFIIQWNTSSLMTSWRLKGWLWPSASVPETPITDPTQPSKPPSVALCLSTYRAANFGCLAALGSQLPPSIQTAGSLGSTPPELAEKEHRCGRCGYDHATDDREAQDLCCPNCSEAHAGWHRQYRYRLWIMVQHRDTFSREEHRARAEASDTKYAARRNRQTSPRLTDRRGPPTPGRDRHRAGLSLVPLNAYSRRGEPAAPVQVRGGEAAARDEPLPGSAPAAARRHPDPTGARHPRVPRRDVTVSFENRPRPCVPPPLRRSSTRGWWRSCDGNIFSSLCYVVVFTIVSVYFVYI